MDALNARRIDVNMPEMDGPELHRRVRARCATSALRLVLVSDHDEIRGDEEHPAADLLAAPCLVKPLSFGDTVNRALGPSHVRV